MFQPVDFSVIVHPTAIQSRVVSNPRVGKQEKIIYIRFSGKITEEAILSWAKNDAPVVLKQVAGSPFFVIADLREASTLSEQASIAMAEGQKHFLAAGLRKSFVATTTPTLLSQFRRIGKESGIAKNESGVYMAAEYQKKNEKRLQDIFMGYAMKWFYDGIEVPIPGKIEG